MRPPPIPARGVATGASRERGVALLLVLLLSLILLPFASEFALQVSLESQTAANVTSQLQIENEIDGQYEVLLAHLRHDALANDIDSYDDAWNRDELKARTSESTGVALTTTAFDEQAKLNLRQLAAEQPERRELTKQRLLRLLVEFRRDTDFELSTSEAEVWANNIAEYVNKGALRSNIPTAKTKDDRTILLLEELQFLPKVGDHLFTHLLYDQREEDDVGPGLHRYVTVYGDGKLNLNTVEERVLRAYFPQDGEIARRIIERRENPPESEGDGFISDEEPAASGNPYTDVNQVNEVEGVTPESLQANAVDPNLDFTTRSDFFSFRVVGETDMSRRDELFVVERVPGASDEEPLEGFRFLLRQERTDILEEVDEEL